MSSSKIITSYWAKPIPLRDCDWSATYDDYEGGDGYSEPAGTIGFGSTEQAAIEDLMTNHPRGTAVPIHDITDRMRTALELIAGLPVGEDEKRLALAVATAKAALADDHDPLCEVLR